MDIKFIARKIGVNANLKNLIVFLNIRSITDAVLFSGDGVFFLLKLLMALRDMYKGVNFVLLLTQKNSAMKAPASTYTKIDVKERASSFVSRLLEHIEKGDVLEWKKTWASFSKAHTNGFCNAVHKKPYQGSNILVVYLDCLKHGYPTSQYLTYEQVLSLARVNNRNKGFLNGENCRKYINLYFCYPIFKESKNEETGLDEIKFAGMRWVQTPNLFNIALTDLSDLFISNDGEEISDVEEWTANLAAAETALNADWLAPYQEENQSRACYIPDLDKILVPLKGQFESGGEYILTLAHEQAHATGHKTRLNRNMTGGKGSAAYAAEELIAEMTSFMFGAEFGIENEANSLAYIKYWVERAKEVPANALFRAIGKAHHAFTFILTGEAPKVEKE